MRSELKIPPYSRSKCVEPLHTLYFPLWKCLAQDEKKSGNKSYYVSSKYKYTYAWLNQAQAVIYLDIIPLYEISMIEWIRYKITFR